MERNMKANLPDLIADNLMNKIFNNYWKVNEKLPSETRLSEEFNVNRLTIRLAINKLNTIGVLETIQGKGTYVRKFDLYNYLNQIVPYIVNSQEISYVLDYEKMLLSSTMVNGDSKEKVEEKLKELNNITNKNVFDNTIDGRLKMCSKIIDLISIIKKEIIDCNDNELLKIIYSSLANGIENYLNEKVLEMSHDEIRFFVAEFIDSMNLIINK